MTFTLGAKTLKVIGFSLENAPRATEWDAWENNSWTVKRAVHGVKRVWRLDCVEDGVSWVDSAAKYFAEQAAAGNTLSFTVTEDPRYSLSATNVYVLNVSLTARLTGTKNIRYFTVAVKEA